MRQVSSMLGVPCLLIAGLLATDAPPAFAQKGPPGIGGKGLPAGGNKDKGTGNKNGGSGLIPKAGNSTAGTVQPNQGGNSTTGTVQPNRLARVPVNSVNYLSNPPYDPRVSGGFAAVDSSSSTRDNPKAPGGFRPPPNTFVFQFPKVVVPGNTVSSTPNTGFVRSNRAPPFVPGQAPAVATATRENAPVNRLPDIIQAQSVRMATDTALVQGEPLLTTTTQLTAGSVIDIAPHLLLREATQAARNPEPLADATERSLLVADAEPALPADVKAPPMRGLCLVNPLENKGPVSFLLNGEAYTLRPGQGQQLSAEEYTINFDKGGQLGAASYELENGSYTFRVSRDKGWDIQGKTYKIAVDNTANVNAFGFLLNGKEATVSAREIKEFKSKYPILASFDPGDNGDPARRWLLGGTYKVGVDPRAQLLELYQTVSTATPKPVGALTPARLDDALVRH